MGNHAQLTAREIHGPYMQLLTNLQGEDGEMWLRALKRFLRQEEVWRKENQEAGVKIILYVHANDLSDGGSVPTLIGRRVRWPVVPRQGETVWVSDGTDLNYPVDRVVNFLIRRGYVELHFSAPKEELLVLFNRDDEEWRNADSVLNMNYWNWYDE